MSKQPYMEQIVKMLDVEIGEEFEIEDYHFNPYHFEEDGLYDVDHDKRVHMLSEILEEKVKIKKLPKQWKLKVGEHYWTIDLRFAGGIRTCTWDGTISENNLLKHNALFKTKEEAVQAYQAVLKTLEEIKE